MTSHIEKALEQAFSAGKRDGRLGYENNNSNEDFDYCGNKLYKALLWIEYQRGYDIGCEISCMEMA